MLCPMAINWNRVGRTAFSLARRYGPQVAQEIQKRTQGGQDGRVGQGGRGGRERLSGAGSTVGAGRPAVTTDQPTSDRARSIAYAPELDGKADPGEIVWTWVEFEEHDGRGKDRPVLVVGRDGTSLLGLMLSSQDKRAGDPNWVGIGSGAWDHGEKPSWVRLDRVLDVPEDGIRREGAIMARGDFDTVARRLREEYGWR